MATIEPRLMHLLNDSQSPDIPPRQLHLLSHASSTDNSLSLPPIEPDGGGQRGDKAAQQQIPSLSSIADDFPSSQVQSSRADGPYQTKAAGKASTGGHHLALLLPDPNTNHSGQSQVHTLLDSQPGIQIGTAEDVAKKKRHRALTMADDHYEEYNFLQLPQPLKKQKSSQQVAPHVPPIITGLVEPPPPNNTASALPPILPGRSHGSKGFPPVPSYYDDPTPDSGLTSGGRKTRRAAKPRRKWSDQETNHLLLGVSKHGAGKWTAILEDQEYNFNDRTAGDLKDRFRTCCPVELRDQLSKKDQPKNSITLKPKKSLPLEDILIDAEDQGDKAHTPASSHDSDSGSKHKKSRAHRKNIEDLEQLGIRGPFKRSERRLRRRFTQQDDEQILEGLEIYGPHWTKIQRDPRFNLSTRQPTDLRDRVRNKYPEIYSAIEKVGLAKESAPGNSLLEPSVYTEIGNSLEPHLNRRNSKDHIPSWSQLPPSSGLIEPHDALPSISTGFDMAAEPPAAGAMTNAGDMDISRLLLDDTAGTVIGHSTYDNRPAKSGPPDAGERERPRTSTKTQVPSSMSLPPGYWSQDAGSW